MGRWNADRWTQTGTTEGGDPVYERNTQAAAPAEKPKAAAKKKPSAKKKA